MPPAGARPAAQPEALQWKFLGAILWHVVVIVISNFVIAVVGLPPSLGSLFKWPYGYTMQFFLFVLNLLSLLGHRLVLSSNEFEPVIFTKLGIHGRSWISLFLTRIIVRGRSWNSFAATAGFFGLNVLSAVAYSYLYAPMKGGTSVPFKSALGFGLTLSIWYSCSYLIRSVGSGCLRHTCSRTSIEGPKKHVHEGAPLMHRIQGPRRPSLPRLSKAPLVSCEGVSA